MRWKEANSASRDAMRKREPRTKLIPHVTRNSQQLCIGLALCFISDVFTSILVIQIKITR